MAYATENWVSGVANTGTFTKPSALTVKNGDSFIPSGWTIVNIEESIIETKSEAPTESIIEPETESAASDLVEDEIEE
jgi:hypothetical protein